MAYDKTKPVAVGHALFSLIEAVSDGVDMGDMDEFLAFTMSLSAAQAEMSQDTDAAVLHVLSGAADAFGDARINPPA